MTSPTPDGKQSPLRKLMQEMHNRAEAAEALADRWEHQSGVNLVHYEAEKKMRRAAEAREAKLREALEKIATIEEYPPHDPGNYMAPKPLPPGRAVKIARAALSAQEQPGD